MLAHQQILNHQALCAHHTAVTLASPSVDADLRYLVRRSDVVRVSVAAAFESHESTATLGLGLASRGMRGVLSIPLLLVLAWCWDGRSWLHTCTGTSQGRWVENALL